MIAHVGADYLRKNIFLKTIRICGVNEHFNFPWRYAIDKGYFLKKGIQLIWTESKGGTGEMTRMLNEGATDLAVLLTEGLVTDILKNNKSRLIQLHVKSPLHWGIHVHRDSAINRPEDINNKIFAISRYGSGSHLMALVHAQNMGWKDQQHFLVVDNLEGGLRAVQEKKADVFLWEKYTTAPYLHEHHLKYAGDVSTPWPSFALAAAHSFCTKEKECLQLVCETITETVRELRNNPETVTMIARTHQLTPEATQKWYNEMEWNEKPGIESAEMNEILHGLCTAGLIQEKECPESDAVFFKLY